MRLTFRQRGGETVPRCLLGLSQQASASQELCNSSIYLVKVCFSHGLAGDDDHVPAICYHRLAEPGCFPHETPGAVANHRPTHPPARRKTEAAIPQVIAQNTKDQKRMSPATAFSTHPLEIRVLSETEPLFHGSPWPLQRPPRFPCHAHCGFQSVFLPRYAPICGQNLGGLNACS